MLFSLDAIFRKCSHILGLEIYYVTPHKLLKERKQKNKNRITVERNLLTEVEWDGFYSEGFIICQVLILVLDGYHTDISSN